MAKKKRESLSKEILQDRFADKEEVTKSVSETTGQESKEKKSNRGRKKLKEKRVPFTTSITPALKKKMQLDAIKKGVRVADILNDILSDHYTW